MDKWRMNTPVLLQTGFRVFFLGAAFYAVLGMVVWFLFYVAGGNIFVAMPMTVWHGHEMVFGFTMAVVAGFLLTAVMNWTGRPTLTGVPLLILFMLWLIARVLAFMPRSFPEGPMATANLSFMMFLLIAVIRPIVAVRQWRQSAVLSKVALILAGGVVFHAGLAQANLLAERRALRFAVYMLVSLIFTIGRRVIPFFVERGVGYSVTLRRYRLLDIASLMLLVVFVVCDIFWYQPYVVAGSSAALVIVHSIRLRVWYTRGVWERPLLWVLFAGYAFLILGFVLKSAAILGRQPDDAALHAWTAGGIGIFTLGMMTRVAWGHTGRLIAEPPRSVVGMFTLVILAAMVRVFLPLIRPESYIMWIAVSQILWIFAFGWYLIVYAPILVNPRPDGRIG